MKMETYFMWQWKLIFPASWLECHDLPSHLVQGLSLLKKGNCLQSTRQLYSMQCKCRYLPWILYHVSASWFITTGLSGNNQAISKEKISLPYIVTTDSLLFLAPSEIDHRTCPPIQTPVFVRRISQQGNKMLLNVVCTHGILLHQTDTMQILLKCDFIYELVCSFLVTL